MGLAKCQFADERVWINMTEMDHSLRARYYWLDWLRFVAAFIVLVGHVRGGHFVDYGELDSKDHSILVASAFMLTRLGQEAVLLFFVLSGFLVGGRSTRKALDYSFRIWPYASDRITRIYVPLLPALLLTAAVLIFRGGHISTLSFLGNLAGLQGLVVDNFGGNAPLWSLAYEIWFYTLWGAVLVLVVNRSKKVSVLAWLAIFAGCAVFTKLQAVYLFCWLVGALACVIKLKMPRVLSLMCSFLLIGVGVGLCQLTNDTVSFHLKGLQAMLPSRSVCLLVLTMGFTLLVTTVADWEPVSPRWRKVEKLGAPLAAFSYTLYLTHFCFIGIWEPFFPGRAKILDFYSVSTFLLELIFCLAAAWVMYFLFEKRTASVRRWLNQRWSTHLSDQIICSPAALVAPTPAKTFRENP